MGEGNRQTRGQTSLLNAFSLLAGGGGSIYMAIGSIPVPSGSATPKSGPEGRDESPEHPEPCALVDRGSCNLLTLPPTLSLQHPPPLRYRHATGMSHASPSLTVTGRHEAKNTAAGGEHQPTAAVSGSRLFSDTAGKQQFPVEPRSGTVGNRRKCVTDANRQGGARDHKRSSGLKCRSDITPEHRPPATHRPFTGIHS